jgi:hypothetical protein
VELHWDDVYNLYSVCSQEILSVTKPTVHLSVATLLHIHSVAVRGRGGGEEENKHDRSCPFPAATLEQCEEMQEMLLNVALI